MVTVDSCQIGHDDTIEVNWWKEVDRCVWTDHFKSLTDFFQRKIRDRDQAEDLAQTTILTALGLQFDSGRSHYACTHDQLAAWLHGIGRNILRAHWASQVKQARKLMLAQQIAIIEYQKQFSRGPAIDADEIEDAIEQELQHCNDKERHTVRQWLSGATYAQIHAGDPSVKLGALHKRISRFASRLRLRLRALQESSFEAEVVYESQAAPGVLGTRLSCHTKESDHVPSVQ